MPALCPTVFGVNSPPGPAAGSVSLVVAGADESVVYFAAVLLVQVRGARLVVIVSRQRLQRGIEGRDKLGDCAVGQLLPVTSHALHLRSRVGEPLIS